MNGFLQQYGLNIVAVIIVLAFIVFASVFGDTITTGVKDITSDFFAKSGVTADVDVNGGNGDIGGNGGVADGNDEEQQYQLSGNWLVNVSINPPSNSITQAINFKDGSTFNDGTEIRIDADSNLWYDDCIVYGFFPLDNYITWIQPGAQWLDFGQEPQEVSKEFYKWFTANATKQ